MKPILGFVGCGLTGVVLLWAAIADARFGYPDERPYVRLSGILLPLEGEAEPSQPALTILVKGASWRFRLAHVEEVKKHDQEDARVDELRRHTVRLYGPTPLLVPLQQPTIMGSPLRLRAIYTPRNGGF